MSLKRYSSVHPVADLPQMMAMLSAKQPQAERQNKGNWYSIRAVSQDEVEVYVYDEIGYWGTTAADFIAEFREIKASRISLRVNSPGGDVFDGIAIYNAIRRHSAHVTSYVDGIAASAASFIAMAGDEVVMSPHAQMMIHEASGLCIGPADDMRQMADLLDKASDNIASIYAERTGGDLEEWRERMKGETWLSDREAVELGLADRIDNESEEDVAARLKAKAESEEPPQDELEEEHEDEPAPPAPIDWGQVLQDVEDEVEATFVA